MVLFIDSLLDRMFLTSLQTAMLATFVWVLCRLVPRLSPSSQSWMWWLVALQALLGLIASPIEISLLTRVPAAVTEMLAPIPLDNVAADTLSAGTMGGSATFSWQAVVFLLWSAGLVFMARFTLRERRRGMDLLARSLPCNNERQLQSLARASETCDVRTPAMRMSDGIRSPVLIGHRRPVLLLPSSHTLNDQELDMALVHELTHLRRGDLWWGLVPSLARHLFFFHPFAHLAVREYGTAREAACDAAVVESGQRSRQDYGRLIVRLGASPESRTGLAVASPTFRSLSRRLKILQSTTFLAGAGPIALLAIVATGALPLRLVAAADEPTLPGAAAISSPTATAAPGLPQYGASGAMKFLEKHIAESEKQLQEMEARLADFRTRNPGVSFSDAGAGYFSRLSAEIAEQKSAEGKLAQATSRQAELQKRAETMKQEFTRSVTDTADDVLNGELRQRRTQAEAKLQELRARFKDTHPDFVAQMRAVEELKNLEASELARLTRETDANALRQLNSDPAWLPNQSELAKMQLLIARLNSDIQSHRKKILGWAQPTYQAPEIEQEYQLLLRAYAVQKSQYEILVTKHGQTVVADEAARRAQLPPLQTIIGPQQVDERLASMSRQIETLTAQQQQLESERTKLMQELSRLRISLESARREAQAAPGAR